jgi:hypothetical protein
MKICQHCGHNNPADASFCVVCGQALNQPSSAQVAPPLVAPTLQPMAGHASPVPGVGGTPQMSHVPTISGAPSTSAGAPNVSASAATHTVTRAARGGKAARTAARTAAKVGTHGHVAGSIVTGVTAKVVIVAVVCVVAAASAVGATRLIATHNTAQHATTAAHTTPALVTKPVPPTLTSCPAPGTARPAVLAPLVLGHDANLVYIDDTQSLGILKRYDAASGKITVLTQIRDELIGNARISADGQWVLFETTHSTDIGFGPPPPPVQTRLSMVRLDGQGLQTLYCPAERAVGDTISNASISWSPTMQYVAFNETDGAGHEWINILDTKNGSLQKQLATTSSPDANGNLLGNVYQPMLWLDNTRLYVGKVVGTNTFPNQSGTYLNIQEGIYLLDLRQGANQQDGNLPRIVDTLANAPGDNNLYIWTIMLNAARTQLYMLKSPRGQGAPTESYLLTQPTTGGAARIIYRDLYEGVDEATLVNDHTLLFSVVFAPKNPQDAGFAQIQTDGTGLKHIAAPPPASGSIGALSASPQQQFFAFESVVKDQPTPLYNTTMHILVGSLHSGTFTTVQASPHPLLDNSTGDLRVAGWTTM